MQPAMIASCDLPLKSFASSVTRNKSFAVSAVGLEMFCESHSVAIWLYAACKLLFALSWLDLLCARDSSRTRSPPSPKPISVESWEPSVLCQRRSHAFGTTDGHTEKRVSCVSNTRRVVVALVVVGKGSTQSKHVTSQAIRDAMLYLHSLLVSMPRSPRTRPQLPQTVSPELNSSTRFGGISRQSASGIRDG